MMGGERKRDRGKAEMEYEGGWEKLSDPMILVPLSSPYGRLQPS